jgi:hypothetical protein
MYTLILCSLFSPSQTATTPKITFAMKPESIRPTEQASRVGELVRLVSNSPKGRWEISPESPGGDLEPGVDGKALFSAEKAGRYFLINYVGDAPAAWVVITVGGAVPPPDPKPIDPIVPPQPDPTATAIRDSFMKDSGDPKVKRADALSLAALWEEGVKLCDDKKVATAGQLVDRLRNASNTLAKDRLPQTRKSIADATAKLFGKPEAELNDSNRKAARELFAMFATTLEELSK